LSRRIADREPVASDNSPRPVAGNGLERLRAREFERASLRRLDDCLRERVLAFALGARDETKQLVLTDAVGGLDRDHLGLSSCERSRLVEDDRVERGCLLKRNRVLE
jgi:hypothetical protein